MTLRKGRGEGRREKGVKAEKATLEQFCGLTTQ